jgi:hypothetical protein
MMKVHWLWCVEEMRNPDQVQQPVEKSLWLAHITRLWIHIVDSKKQTSKGLKKIDDNLQKWYVHKWSKMNQNENEDIHTSQ